MRQEVGEAAEGHKTGQGPREQAQGKQPAQEGASAASSAECAIPQGDSTTFARCGTCVHADEMDAAAGTLLCKKHDMRINAEADEIPDDCVEFEPRGGA